MFVACFKGRILAIEGDAISLISDDGDADAAEWWRLVVNHLAFSVLETSRENSSARKTPLSGQSLLVILPG